MLAVSANGGVQHWPRARSIRYDFSQSSHLWNGNRKETARRTGLEEKYERSFFLMKRPVLLCESSINKRVEIPRSRWIDEISSSTVDEPTSVYFPTEANVFRRFKRILASRFKGIIITKKKKKKKGQTKRK